jgi:hypothetical protein
MLVRPNGLVNLGSAVSLTADDERLSLRNLFNVGGDEGFDLGISYDPSNNSLWISGWNTTYVTDYSLGGSVLSSFSTGHTENSALAFDPNDGTLWLNNRNTIGINLQQYSTSGTLLGTLTFGNDVNILGGEFPETASPTPEPSSMLLGATGAALLLAGGICRRFKKREIIVDKPFCGGICWGNERMSSPTGVYRLARLLRTHHKD